MNATTGAIKIDGTFATTSALNLDAANGQIVVGVYGSMSSSLLNVTSQGIEFGGRSTSVGDVRLDAHGYSLNVTSTGALTSSQGTMIITADELTLDGSVQCPQETLHIHTTTGRTMALGSAAGGVSLTGEELQRVTAGGMHLHGTANIGVNGVTASHSAHITGMLTLIADASQAQVTFGSLGSTFHAVNVNADGGLVIEGDVSSLTSHILLNGDVDAQGTTPQDRIDFASGISVASSGVLELQAHTGALKGAGTLTLQGKSTVILHDSLSVVGTGNLTIMADSDRDGAGILQVDSTALVEAKQGAMAVTAADLQLPGTSTMWAQGALSLLSSSWLSPVSLGPNPDSFHIDHSELQRITAASLTVGGSYAPKVTVVGLALGSRPVGPVSLISDYNGGQVLFVNASSSFPSSLAVTSKMIVTMSVNVTAQGHVAISTGNLTIHKSSTMSSGGSSIAVVSDGLSLDGKLLAGTATVSIGCYSNGTSVGIGQGLGSLNLENRELSLIQGQGFTVGDERCGTVHASGVTDVAHLGDTSILTGGHLSFGPLRSSFFSLQASALTGLLDGKLNTTHGSLSMKVACCMSDRDTKPLHIQSGVQLVSASNLSFHVGLGGATYAGPLSLYAEDGIYMDSSITAIVPLANLTLDSTYTSTTGRRLMSGIRRVWTRTQPYERYNRDEGLGQITLAPGKVVDSLGARIDITAVDVDNYGTIKGGSIVMQPTQQGALFYLSQPECLRIIASESLTAPGIHPAMWPYRTICLYPSASPIRTRYLWRIVGLGGRHIGAEFYKSPQTTNWSKNENHVMARSALLSTFAIIIKSQIARDDWLAISTAPDQVPTSAPDETVYVSNMSLRYGGQTPYQLTYPTNISQEGAAWNGCLENRCSLKGTEGVSGFSTAARKYDTGTTTEYWWTLGRPWPSPPPDILPGFDACFVDMTLNTSHPNTTQRLERLMLGLNASTSNNSLVDPTGISGIFYRTLKATGVFWLPDITELRFELLDLDLGYPLETSPPPPPPLPPWHWVYTGASVGEKVVWWLIIISTIIFLIKRKYDEIQAAIAKANAEEEATGSKGLEAQASQLREYARKLKRAGRDEAAKAVLQIATHLSTAAGYKSEAFALKSQACVAETGNGLQRKRAPALHAESSKKERMALEEMRQVQERSSRIPGILEASSGQADAEELEKLYAQRALLKEERDRMTGMAPGAERDHLDRELQARIRRFEKTKKDVEQLRDDFNRDKAEVEKRRAEVENWMDERGPYKEEALQALLVQEADIVMRRRELERKEGALMDEKDAIEHEQEAIWGLPEGDEKKQAFRNLETREFELEQKIRNLGRDGPDPLADLNEEIKGSLELASSRTQDQSNIVGRRAQEVPTFLGFDISWLSYFFGRSRVQPLHEQYAANPIWQGDDPQWRHEIDGAWDAPGDTVGRGGAKGTKSAVVMYMDEFGVLDDDREKIEALRIHNERRVLTEAHQFQDGMDQWSNELSMEKLKPDLKHLKIKPKRFNRVWDLVDAATPREPEEVVELDNLHNMLHELDTEGMATRILGKNAAQGIQVHPLSHDKESMYMANRRGRSGRSSRPVSTGNVSIGVPSMGEIDEWGGSRASTPPEMQMETSPLVQEDPWRSSLGGTSSPGTWM